MLRNPLADYLAFTYVIATDDLIVISKSLKKTKKEIESRSSSWDERDERPPRTRRTRRLNDRLCHQAREVTHAAGKHGKHKGKERDDARGRGGRGGQARPPDRQEAGVLACKVRLLTCSVRGVHVCAVRNIVLCAVVKACACVWKRTAPSKVSVRKERCVMCVACWCSVLYEGCSTRCCAHSLNSQVLREVH
jgi:hypothetical protein